MSKHSRFLVFHHVKINNSHDVSFTPSSSSSCSHVNNNLKYHFRIATERFIIIEWQKKNIVNVQFF